MRELLLITFLLTLAWSAINLSCIPEIVPQEEIEFSEEVNKEASVLISQHEVPIDQAFVIAKLNVDKRRRLNGYNTK